ncbi:MAG: hypothetical protein CMA72_06035 [Euryarchaeota archaeon]|nr:hypothetical protein [Euryarchaeota archaeon]|tara:strand:+ start:6575 stop:6943 length:369 start_codon:yes stop_codon:yes gene_type:complete
MNITSTFLPIGLELTTQVFPTDIVYRRHSVPTYDPAVGDVVETITEFPIKAGVLFTERTEEGGAAETRELNVWVSHDDSVLPFLPTTRDTVSYDGSIWKVVAVAPTYQSAGLIASKLVARHQ